MTVLWYWFKAAKSCAVSGFYWIDFDPSTFSLYKLSPKGGKCPLMGRFYIFLIYFPVGSLCGVPPDSLRSSSPLQLLLSQMLISQIEPKLRLQWSAGGWLPSVHCRALAALPLWPGWLASSIKSKRLKNTTSDNTVINCNHNWDFND